MYSAAHHLLEQNQIWSSFGLRQRWCFGDCHERPQNYKCLPHPLLPASTRFTSHIMWPHHLGHKQMGSGTGVWVGDYDQKPTRWFSLRTPQKHSALKSVNPMQLHAPSGEVSMEAETRQEKPPGADTSHPDRESRATGKKAVGGGRQAVA